MDGLPPARDGLEVRLDRVIDLLQRLVDRAEEPKVRSYPAGAVELRGAGGPPASRPDAPARRRPGP